MSKATMFRWNIFYELWMACETSEERAELWQAIMEYGLYWKEPPEKFKRDFVNVRFILNKSVEISKKRSEAWKLWWASQWNSNAVKTWGNDTKQAKTNKDEQNQTKQANQTSISISLTSSKEEEKNKRKEEMLEAFRKDTRLTPYMEEDDVSRRLDQKELIKKPYQDVKSFITSMIKVKNNIASWKPKSDQNRRNRFSFLVDTAIDKKREWLKRYDNMEQEFLDSKDDLFPTPKQNE